MRILLVGGEASLSAELLEYIGDLGDEWEVESVPDGSAAIVAVSSATIDADRFSKHFESSKGPAPVVFVSGRMFPVELRYRPLQAEPALEEDEAAENSLEEERDPQNDVAIVSQRRIYLQAANPQATDAG